MCLEKWKKVFFTLTPTGGLVKALDLTMKDSQQEDETFDDFSLCRMAQLYPIDRIYCFTDLTPQKRKRRRPETGINKEMEPVFDSCPYALVKKLVSTV